MVERIFTSYEAARVLKRSDSRVRQLAHAGILKPAFVTAGGKMLFRVEDVEALRIAREAKAA